MTTRTLRTSLALLLAASLPLTASCFRFTVSPEVVYLTEAGEDASKPAVADPAKKRNDLTAGILPPKVVGPGGKPADEEAGEPDDIGRWLEAALQDAKVFKDLRYPLRDEAVDVVIQPIAEVRLSKNRATNALTAFPGLLLPWVEGFGFDYDHEAALTLEVRTGKERELCDQRRAESRLTAERYPSTLWLLGVHVGVLMLTIFESATTDHLVREKLVERNVGRAIADDVSWLARELAPEGKACPAHPDAPKGGKFCVYCGRSLWYPILDRRAGRERAPPAAAERSAPRAVTQTAR